MTSKTSGREILPSGRHFDPLAKLGLLPDRDLQDVPGTDYEVRRDTGSARAARPWLATVTGSYGLRAGGMVWGVGTG